MLGRETVLGKTEGSGGNQFDFYNSISLLQMISKYELQNIISGIGGGPESSFIQAAAGFLRTSTQAGGETEKIKQSKSEEEQKLIDWIDQNEY